MGQFRTVNTPSGPIAYELVRKRVKNLNLRLTAGRVKLSGPNRCPLREADRLIWEKSAWIAAALRRLEEERAVPLPPPPPRKECEALLRRSLERVYPLVAPLGVAVPELKLRAMRSQWGNCHWAQGYITLNTALAWCPEELRDYVALHELVHFLHRGHGPDFYARMDALMPDWRRRREELRRYDGALIPPGGENRPTFSREKK